VSLLFPGGRRQNNLQGDARTQYSVTSLSGSISLLNVSRNGAIATADASQNRTGVARVTVSFIGQNVTATVDITVTNYRDIEVVAVPNPSYSGSTSIRLTSLHPIANVTPPQYEKATATMRMLMMAGSRSLADRDLSNSVATYALSSDPGVLAAVSPGSAALSVQGGSSSGVINISGTFSGTVATISLQLTVSGSSVRITEVLNLRLRTNSGRTLRNGGTFGGRRDVSTARMALGVRLSNGRQIPNAVSDLGAISLPGVFLFATGTPSVLNISTTTGLVTLLDNHHSNVVVSVLVASSSALPGSSMVVACNLEPLERGDVDLGASNGPPIAAQRVREYFTVDVRVNTGQQTLASFNLVVVYNASVMEVNDSTTFPIGNSGTVQEETAVRADRVPAQVLMPGIIVGSTFSGTNQLLARLMIRALVPGVHQLTGLVVVLQDDGQPPSDIARNRTFDAGTVTFLADNGRRRRDEARTDLAVPHLAQSVLMDGSVGNRQRRQSCDTATSAGVRGDVDCNCEFQPSDALFVHTFVASRGVSQSAGRTYVENTRARCGHVDRALDVDHSGGIDAADAKMLLQIIATKAYFADLSVRPSNATSACTANLSVSLFGPANVQPPSSGVSVLFLVRTQGLSANQVQQALNFSGGMGIALLQQNVANSADSPQLLVRADRIEGTRMFSAVFSHEGALSNVGISVVLLITTSTPRLQLYVGLEPTTAAPVRTALYPPFAMLINLAEVQLSQSGALWLNTTGTLGYNPRTVLNHSPASSACAGVSLTPTAAPTLVNTTASPTFVSPAPSTTPTTQVTSGPTQVPSRAPTEFSGQSPTTQLSATSLAPTLAPAVDVAGTRAPSQSPTATNNLSPTADLSGSGDDASTLSPTFDDSGSGIGAVPTIAPTALSLLSTEVPSVSSSTSQTPDLSATESDSDGEDFPWWLFLVIAMGLLLILVVLVLVQRRRHRDNKHVTTQRAHDDPTLFVISNEAFLASDDRPTTTTNFAAGLEGLDSFLVGVEDANVGEGGVSDLVSGDRTASTGAHDGPLRQIFLPGADVGATATLVDDSIFQAVDQTDVGTVRRILEAGMSAHGDAAEYEHYGYTPLQLAVLRNCSDICKLLLQHGRQVKPNATQRHAMKHLCPLPPLHLLAKRGTGTDVIETLVEGGLNVNGRDSSGQTALHIAAATGNLPVAEELLRFGANVKAVEHVSGHTALHTAAESGDTAMVELLAWSNLRAVNHPDRKGRTPLHAAALTGAIDVTLALLEAGARCNVMDHSGCSAQDVVGPGQADLFKLLSAHRQLERATSTGSAGYRDVAPAEDQRPPEDDHVVEDENVLDVDECIDAFAFGTFEF